MTSAIETFFSAWGMTGEEDRAATIGRVFGAKGRYADPRTPEVLIGPGAVAGYVAAFGAGAPGWHADVAASATTAGMVRVTVAFGGPGPDGAPVQQLGQYFVRLGETGTIAEMVGFAGLGEPA